MTPHEVSADLLHSNSQERATPAARPARAGERQAARPRDVGGAQANGRPRRMGGLRAAVTAGLAAGALILAAPAASAAQPAATPSHSAVAESSMSSTLPTTITLTTRRTGSVIL